MDYTPGAMMNATKADFKPIFNRPMSQGTRCQQLAMYVVFESPLQMLADSPSNYRKEPESLAFLSAVPTVWDETRVLSAAVGEHILVARRSGRDWYVGALTNWTPRDLEVPLSFLGDLAALGAGSGKPTSSGTARTPTARAWTTRARSGRFRAPTASRSTWRQGAGSWRRSRESEARHLRTCDTANYGTEQAVTPTAQPQFASPSSQARSCVSSSWPT